MKKTVIFDVDGVLLSEKRYFDVSALAVWEWYYGSEFMNLGGESVTAELDDAQIDALRARFWKDGEILTWLKGHGVNSNWDMVHAHIVTTLWLMLEDYAASHGAPPAVRLETMDDVRALGRTLNGLEAPDAARVLARLERTVSPEAQKNEVFAALTAAAAASIGNADWTPLASPLWQLHFESFQEWYFGDALYERTYKKKPCAAGKSGFLQREKPLGTAEGIRGMFRELKRRGYEIAIATGRSRPEVQIPFDVFRWTEEFDPLHVATYTDVEEASGSLGLSLDKPHPFVYCVGAFGRRSELYGDYVSRPSDFKEGTYYIVGDSLADAWCAKAFGAVMIATLTGLDGPAARVVFERENADYIINTVEEILKILH